MVVGFDGDPIKGHVAIHIVCRARGLSVDSSEEVDW